MGRNQDANWCVTKPFFDYVMGTRLDERGEKRDWALAGMLVVLCRQPVWQGLNYSHPKPVRVNRQPAAADPPHQGLFLSPRRLRRRSCWSYVGRRSWFQALRRYLPAAPCFQAIVGKDELTLGVPVEWVSLATGIGDAVYLILGISVDELDGCVQV